MLAAAKIAGELAERIGQPAVLGELLAGVALGASILGVVDPADPLIHLLAQFGVIILLFEIGLETDLRRLLRVGPASSIVAIVGVVLPFGLGYAALVGLGFPALPAVVAGAALTATSVGITARVLSDLGRLHEPESQIVLGAAVIDDVIGLIILAVVAKAVAGAHLTLSGVAMTTALAFGFLAAVLAVGTVAGPPLFRLLARLSREETLATMGLALGFLVAYLADISGSALIVGAFAAGLVVERTPQAPVVGRGIVALGQFFVPIFFVAVGAAVDVRSFLDPGVLTVGAALIAVAIVGKVAAGYAPIWSTAKKSVIGVGMMPRGEVGLIFAQMGLTAGVLSAGLFSALTLMVMVTTFLAPPLLKILFPPLGEGLPPPPEGVAKITTEA
ncbi:MAG: cation:proton antiporter [Gemmatimonadetes bacterium]|nr:cation:proton antiporter [Gemmatimonadota bacterium]